MFCFSLCQGNFLCTVMQEEFSTVHFDMTKSVPVILKLLEIDKNLARMHAKLSPKMDEEVFWKNYFLRVKYLRAAIGQLSAQLHFAHINNKFKIETNWNSLYRYWRSWLAVKSWEAAWGGSGILRLVPSTCPCSEVITGFVLYLPYVPTPFPILYIVYILYSYMDWIL